MVGWFLLEGVVEAERFTLMHLHTCTHTCSSAPADGAHYDFFFDDVHIRSGGNRFATVLMWVSVAVSSWGGAAMARGSPFLSFISGGERSACVWFLWALMP